MHFIRDKYQIMRNLAEKFLYFLANVTFEPGCRNNWHIHHAKSGGGQALAWCKGG